MPRQDQSGRPLPTESSHEFYIDDSDEDDGNWSDSPSENNVVREHRATTGRYSNPRRQERPNPNRPQHEPHVNRPAQFSYNTGAGGQAVPYGEYRFIPESNPFSPNPFSPNPPPNTRHTKQHTANPNPPPNFPARPYRPADSYDRNSWYSKNYFQGSPYAHPTNSRPVNTYPYVGDPYFGNPYPPLPQRAPYGVVPAVQQMSPMVSPSPLERQLDKVWRELDEVKMDQHEAKKQEEERLRAKRKQTEAASRRKKDIEKIKKHFERKARTEVNETLQRERAFRDSETRSDPCRTQLPYGIRAFPAAARQMQDALLYLDDRGGREPDHVLDEIAQFIESRRQGRRWSDERSVRSSLDGANTRRVEAVPRAFYDAKTDPNFRNQVEEVVINLLRGLKLDGKEDDRLPLPPVSEREASDGYPASEGHGRRTRVRQPDSSRTQMPTTSSLSHETIYVDDYQQPPLQESSRSTDRWEGHRASSRRPDENSRNPQAPHNNTNAPNTHQSVGPRVVDSGYSSPNIAQIGRARDRVNNVRFVERVGQPISGQDPEEYERTRGRMYSQFRPRGRREVNQEALQGIISSSDSEDQSLGPRGPPRTPAPYALRQGHPNLNREYPLPRVPDAPFGR